MKKEEIYSKILGCGVTTYYNWKREDDRPVMKILDKYFFDEELVEFLQTGEILKYKLIQEFSSNQKSFNEEIIQIINTLIKRDDIRPEDAYSYDELDWTPYIDSFIEYLFIAEEINSDTYTNFMIDKSQELALYNKQAANESEDELMLIYRKNNKIIQAIIEIQKIILKADRNLLLQLEILMNSDFEQLLKQATKKELKDILLPFLHKWIMRKYNTYYECTKEKLDMIYDMKTINLHEVIMDIKNSKHEIDIRNAKLQKDA